mmetsp:Transcript_101767/g.292002  ORF Transcript_101767/g.292002 Transcript_101767/m.292002 type:complete len:133 (-) Transcript_101767:245-643(-)
MDFGHMAEDLPDTCSPLECRGRRVFSDSAMNRPRLRSGAPAHGDLQFRCSVKNSFLHIQHHSSDEGEDFSCCSSQRSSSLPPKAISVMFEADDWQSGVSIEPGVNIDGWVQRHVDFPNLDFEWGHASRVVGL